MISLILSTSAFFTSISQPSQDLTEPLYLFIFSFPFFFSFLWVTEKMLILAKGSMNNFQLLYYPLNG